MWSLMRRALLVTAIAGALVSGCGATKKPQTELVRIPNVIGWEEGRGIKRLYAAGLCPLPVWGDTIGGSTLPYTAVLALTPPAGTRVEAHSTVEVMTGPADRGADIFVLPGC
jgi:hypothetical protein